MNFNPNQMNYNPMLMNINPMQMEMLLHMQNQMINQMQNNYINDEKETMWIFNKSNVDEMEKILSKITDKKKNIFYR